MDRLIIILFLIFMISKVIHRLPMPYVGDELHHFGWNACSSCYTDATRSRDKLILPAFGSDRVYIIDVGTKPRAPRHFKIIEPDVLHEKLNVSAPHTTHCLADGNIMISTLGDIDGNSKGRFYSLYSSYSMGNLRNFLRLVQKSKKI